jgi:hypothetical protein
MKPNAHLHIDHGLLPGQVLQRRPGGATVSFTGTCRGEGRILATVFSGRRPLPGFASIPVGKAAAGRCSGVLRRLPTGGPYTIRITCGDDRHEIPGILVGDLWLLAGQSNMEGIARIDPLQRVPTDERIRCFTMARRWETAREPLLLLAESPDPVHGGKGLSAQAARVARRTAQRGSGVGLRFAHLMLERTGVPQGLIATAHGGTSMRQWDPALRDRGGASLYGSMLLSLAAAGQPLAGVLWYQGESDTRPEFVAPYADAMRRFVAAVRSNLAQPRLPWIMVQIGRHLSGDDPRPWNDIQEIQRTLPQSIPALEVVAANDLEMDDRIHLSGAGFDTLARRLAGAAARLVLRERAERPAPQLRRIRTFPAGGHRQTPTVEVEFAHAVGGLQADPRPLGLTLVDGERRPIANIVYKTVLHGDRAVLHLMDEPEIPTWLCYGSGRDPVCNVRDGRGHALPSFGPTPCHPGLCSSPWAVDWLVSPVLPGDDISTVPRPAADASGWTARTFAGPFVDMHQDWDGRSGHAAFRCRLEVPEDMTVELRLGYDGPIRLRINADELLCDPDGRNPAIRDARRIACRLSAGSHRVEVLMGLNHGAAWGFYLRCLRPDRVPAQRPPMPSFHHPKPDSIT